MSDLQDVCDRLLATASATSRVSAELGGLAHQLRSTAAKLSTSGGAGHPEVGTTVQTLALAAASCARASDLLAASVQTGRSFVARTVGGATTGGAGGSSGPGETSIPRDSAPSLSLYQQTVLRSATPTRAGVAFFAANDVELLTGSALVPKFPGEFAVDVHGNEDIVGLKGDPPIALSAVEFADVLRASGWDGSPVRLLGCRTGRREGGFAQQLADELGVRVTAADTSVVVDDRGNVALYDAYRQPNPIDALRPWTTLPGHWHQFDPRTTNEEDLH